jgi:hypothetical protein
MSASFGSPILFPKIFSVSPILGRPGDAIVITGTNFKNNQLGSTLTFGGVSLGIASVWTDGRLVVIPH